jgi:hypothetical protein
MVSFYKHVVQKFRRGAIPNISTDILAQSEVDVVRENAQGYNPNVLRFPVKNFILVIAICKPINALLLICIVPCCEISRRATY